MTMEEIKNVVCGRFGIPLDVLNSNSHNGKVKHAQSITVYIAHEIISIRYDVISSSFGKRDNAWAIFMNKTASKRMDAEDQFAVEVEEINNLLLNPNRK